MSGFSLRLLALLLIWTSSVIADAAGAVSPERGAGRSQRRGGGSEKRRRLHRIQHGQCSYTFLLPELDACQRAGAGAGAGSRAGSSFVQRDSPPGAEWSAQKLQQLESTMENNTQWLQKLEHFIQKSVRPNLGSAAAHVVHNQTAAMLEMGTTLLTHTAEQTRKLSAVEAQVLNHTSRMEIQLLESSLSTSKLEKELLLQTSEISRLRDRNSRLESKVQVLESRQRGELEDMRQDKNRLQSVVRTQVAAIASLERQLRAASSNNTALQRQQAQLMESVHSLINMVASSTGSPPRVHMWRDCADAYKAGHSLSGLYHIYIGNKTEPVQVYCDMETGGGGWTVFQRRLNGSVDFQRSWREYRTGFGDVSGEHWLGNEALHLLSSQDQYSLRVELLDWEGNQAHSQYDRFTLGSEQQQYRRVHVAEGCSTADLESASESCG
ncbi:angiopoietin-4 isoform X2 [Betta splendens]|uniref:Angiopoietin-4 isoform X2 n=1 Tax=Betta splendens TaxID=158456 RepID=A0A9W2XU81_BETSP|nr:angiopoietin-4 isoform X2 [Betta splendens]